MYIAYFGQTHAAACVLPPKSSSVIFLFLVLFCFLNPDLPKRERKRVVLIFPSLDDIPFTRWCPILPTFLKVTRHDFVANCNRIKLHCAHIECFLYSLSCGEHVGSLPSLAIVNSAPVNTDVQASLSGSDCRSSGSGSYGMQFLSLLLEPPLGFPYGCSLANLTTQSDLRYLPVSNRSIIKCFSTGRLLTNNCFEALTEFLQLKILS